MGEKSDIVSQVLKLAQLAHGDRVPQVDVRGSGVIAAVNPERASLLQSLAQFALHHAVGFLVAKFSALHQDG